MPSLTITTIAGIPYIRKGDDLAAIIIEGLSHQVQKLDDGDILVIDRSEELKNNKIAVCYLNGDFTVKRVKIEKDHIYLIPENKNYDPIKVTEENEFIVWGVVTYVVKKV